MATTTATITLASTDLLSDELALTTTATLTGAGNSTGLTGTAGLARKTVTGGHAQYTLFDGSDYTADKAHKVYLKNTSTSGLAFLRSIKDLRGFYVKNLETNHRHPILDDILPIYHKFFTVNKSK